MVIEEAAKICEETLLPLNQVGDQEGCKFDKGNVYTPQGFKEAYKLFTENGWQGIIKNAVFAAHKRSKILAKNWIN